MQRVSVQNPTIILKNILSSIFFYVHDKIFEMKIRNSTNI